MFVDDEAHAGASYALPNVNVGEVSGLIVLSSFNETDSVKDSAKPATEVAFLFSCSGGDIGTTLFFFLISSVSVANLSGGGFGVGVLGDGSTGDAFLTLLIGDGTRSCEGSPLASPITFFIASKSNPACLGI
jgi:hypothetical protein